MSTWSTGTHFTINLVKNLNTKDFYLQVSLFVQASKDKKCQPHATDVEMLD